MSRLQELSGMMHCGGESLTISIRVGDGDVYQSTKGALGAEIIVGGPSRSPMPSLCLSLSLFPCPSHKHNTACLLPLSLFVSPSGAPHRFLFFCMCCVSFSFPFFSLKQWIITHTGTSCFSNYISICPTVYWFADHSNQVKGNAVIPHGNG